VTDLGIDLGATSIRAGWRTPQGELQLAPADDGETAVPAAVWYASDTDIRVGQAARPGLADHPDQVVASVRTELLTTSRGRYYHGRFVLPETAAATVYEDAVQRASRHAGPPGRVMIGIPAAAGRQGERLLSNAASAAGLTQRQSIAEPVAVALHYGALQEGVDLQAVVCDIGGATLDVSVLRIRDLNVETCYAESAPLGGRAWDAALAGELLAQAQRAAPGLGGAGDSALRAAALRAAEELRIALASAPQASVLLRAGAGAAAAEVGLDRDQLVSLAGDVLARTVAAVRAGLAAADEPPDTLLMAGAASQLPCIAADLRERLGLEVRQESPELAVVSGLTLAAGLSLLFATGTAAAPAARAAAPARPVARAAQTPPPAPGTDVRDDPDPVVRDPDPRTRATPAPGAGPATAGRDATSSGTAGAPEPADPATAGGAAPEPASPGPASPAADGSGDLNGPDEQDSSPAPGGAARGTDPAPDPLDDPGPAARPGRGDQMRAQPVAQLTALRRSEHLLLTWIWPADSQAARVQWQHDGDPPERAGSARCSRRVYEHDGGFDLEIGRGGVTVTVDALVPGDDPDDQPPSSRHIDPLPSVVTYDPAVHRRLRRSLVTVTFVSDSDCELPPAQLILGTGSYRPLSSKDGTVLMELPRQRLTARQPATVSTEVPTVRGPCWLVCLRTDDDPGGPELRPLALHRLKVR